MTQARNKDLWGDIPEVLELTPRDLMREQAVYLEQRTKGLLTAEVVLSSEPVNKGALKQTQTFYLVVSTMQYRYELFSIYQKDAIVVYPVLFTINDKRVEVQNEEQLINVMRDILASDKTKRIVSSLLAQAKSA